MGKQSLITNTTSRERVDADTMASESVVDLEMRREREKIEEQRQRETMIAQCHEMIGQIRAVKMMSKFGDVASLVWAQDVKTHKLYLDLPGLGSWEKFCDYIGISRRKMDEDLQNLRTFGEDFMATVAGLSVGYKDLRKLRQISHDGDIVIDREFVPLYKGGDMKVWNYQTKIGIALVLGIIIAMLLTLFLASTAKAAALAWDEYDNQAAITGFVIYSQEVGTDDLRSIKLDDPAATSYPLNPLNYQPGRTYRFWISAYNDAQESERTQAENDWTVPVFSPLENPPDIVITIPGPVGRLQINVDQ